jgi:4-hydroxybutyryl-CoA dehydratase/vinylacetyl-CoA-Delta-isomerase
LPRAKENALMKTGEEFVGSLRGLQLQLYVLGEKVDDPTEHPILRPSLNALARTYDLAHDPNRAGLFVRRGLDGKGINCFTSLHQGTQDLLDKVRALRILGQETGTCFQRCVGWDALNALESTTFEMDQALGTGYHSRLVDYLRYVQREDLV